MDEPRCVGWKLRRWLRLRGSEGWPRLCGTSGAVLLRTLCRPSRDRDRDCPALRGGAGEQAGTGTIASVPAATAEVLSVISRPPNQLQPVLDAVSSLRREPAKQTMAISVYWAMAPTTSPQASKPSCRRGPARPVRRAACPPATTALADRAVATRATSRDLVSVPMC